MSDLEYYRQQLFTLNNPLFYTIFISFVIIFLLLLLYVKVFYPLLLKMKRDRQKHLLEKTELMALFAELDPDPLLRINLNGEVIQSNDASRKLFAGKELIGTSIENLIPSLMQDRVEPVNEKIIEILGRHFSVIIQTEEKYSFTNIYLHDITTLKEYEEELEKYKRNLISLSFSLDKQIEALKKELSSELHDDICQRMILTKMKISQGNKYSSAEIEKDLGEVTERLREISHTLVPLNISAFGLGFTLQNLVSKISEGSDIAGEIQFVGSIDNAEAELEEKVKNLIIRFVQEALTNIVKHSKASKFFVRIIINVDQIEIVVSDNGVGIKAKIDDMIQDENSGIGLFRMRERVREINGALLISSDEKFNTNLKVTIPINL